MLSRQIRVLVGGLAWGTALGLVCWVSVRHVQRELGQRIAPDLWNYATQQRSRIRLIDSEECDLRHGDPVFQVSSSGQLEQIGEVRRVTPSDAPSALLYSNAPQPTSNHQLSWYSTPDSMAWVIDTLLPASKRALVAAEIQEAVALHQDDLLAGLKPLVEQSLEDAFAVVRQELPTAIRAHRDDIDRIGRRYQQELIDKEVLPIVQQEILPLVRQRAGPTVNEIGSDLWKRVSLWRFTWRYVYDKTPLLPNRKKFRTEFDRFVDKEAMPVLASHSEDIVEVLETVIRDASANPRVREAARRGGSKILDDPELRRLLWTIVRRTTIDNPRFQQAMRDTWTGPQARQLLATAGRRFEPTVRRIGEMLIGTPETGITPEFAAVLRNQVLGKDKRWLILERPVAARPRQPTAGTTPLVTRLRVVRGRQPVHHPFLAQAGPVPVFAETEVP